MGAFIAPLMGRSAPDQVLGVHVNALVTFPSSDPADMAALTEAERGRLAAMKEWQQRSGAYLQVQGTRPQTIGQSLVDSPAGLLAWIVEKFQEWTDPAAKLPEDAVDRDRILTDVSIYWFTATADSAAHTYYERFNDPSMWMPRERSTVPTAVAVFTTDLSIRPFANKVNNVVHWSEFDRGGHFAALEAPRSPHDGCPGILPHPRLTSQAPLRPSATTVQGDRGWPRRLDSCTHDRALLSRPWALTGANRRPDLGQVELGHGDGVCPGPARRRRGA